LEAHVRSRTDLRLRVVDIEAWGSPVAKQYEIHSLPQVWLYEDGEFVSKDLDEVLNRIAF